MIGHDLVHVIAGLVNCKAILQRNSCRNSSSRVSLIDKIGALLLPARPTQPYPIPNNRYVTCHDEASYSVPET